MGLLRALRLVRSGAAADESGKASAAAPSPPTHSDRSAQFSLTVPAEITGVTTAAGVAPRIGRREALQVPAVLRSRNLICSPLSTLPIRVHGPDRRVVSGTQYLVPDPDPDIAASVVMAQTIEDLLFESVSWWRVTRFGWHGYPVEARHVPVTSVHVAGTGPNPNRHLVSPDQPIPVDGQVFIDGLPVPDREVIRFDSPNPPLLEHAARAIRTCLQLDTSAALYAKDPLPLGYFADASPDTNLSNEEVEQILDDWEKARHKRAWGYAGGLKPETLQWSPEQLQMADSRQHAVLEIARAAGVDAEDLGVSTTSRTYQNGESRRQAFLDFTLAPFVSTIEQRLSMRDVLPRGYSARIDFGGFLRSDTKTRMETYKVGLEVGAYTREEIRELEDRPSLTPSQARQLRPRPAPVAAPVEPSTEQAEEAAAMSYVNRYDFGATFAETDAPVQVSFGHSATVAASFRVDPDKRTISGLLMPWGEVAESGLRRYKFAKDSLYWSDVSRIKLFRDHDYGRGVGVAVRLQNTDHGLDATWRVARGAEGDEVLRLAEDQVLDGLSAGVDFGVDDEWQPDPSDESVRLVRRARLREGSITALPAFDSARVSAVTASRNTPKGNEPMSDNSTEATAAEGQAPAAPDLAQFTTGVSEALTKAVEETFARLPLPQHDTDAQRPVPAGRVQVVSEPPIYSFAGHGPSVVRDAWHARVEGNEDARDRLRKFGRQQQEILDKFNQRPELAFAAETTSTVSQVVPPNYRPDMYVSQLLQGRPLADSVSRGTLTDATPFTIPRFKSVTNAAGDHTEGSNPASDGNLTLETVTVTPAGTSGKFTLSREIIDSANPAIDAIAFGAMREAYAQNTEAKVYAELNGSTGQGGTPSGGFVTSGAQVSTTTGGSAGSGTFGGPELIAGARATLALYPFRRFGAPNRMHISQEATSAFAAAVSGTDGRPMLPSVGATNTAGVGNAVSQGWFIDGLAAVPTWSMSGNAAGDGDVLIFNSADVWAWESPLLTFRFEEKQGPANIELALFGYFATRLIRPVGLASIRHTVGV